MTNKPKWTDLFGIDPNYTKDATEEPKYTESDMRVLTEAALRLGRKEMAEELAKAFEERRPLPGWGVFSRPADITTAARMVRLYARELLPLPTPDATSGRTDPGGPNG